MMIRYSLIILACVFVLFELSSCRHVTSTDSSLRQHPREDWGDEDYIRIKRNVVLPAQLPPEMEGVENAKTEKLKKFFDSELVPVTSSLSSEDHTFHISEIRVICPEPLKIECYFDGGNSWTVLEWNGGSEDWDTIGGGETITDEIICRFPPEYVNQDSPLDDDQGGSK